MTLEKPIVKEYNYFKVDVYREKAQVSRSKEEVT